MNTNQLVQTPVDTSSETYLQLGYLESVDAILGKTYAFVAYKATHRETGEQTLKISGNLSATTVVNTDRIGEKCLTALRDGAPYISVGYHLKPSPEDARHIETRVYHREGVPHYVVFHLATRGADGLAQTAQTMKLELPSQPKTETKQLLALPADSPHRSHRQLAYVAAHDGILVRTYAYLAYVETNLSNGSWQIRITGNLTAGTALDPKRMIAAAQKAQAAGQEYFNWGFRLEPRAEDPRKVETRVYQQEGKPKRVAIHLITRDHKGEAREEIVAGFDWPE